MRLLFLNALKGLRKKKIQMFCIITMIMLSTAVYVGMNSAIDRLENKYYDYLDQQNVEDISIYVSVDYTKDVTVDMLDELLENEFSTVTDEEMATLYLYRNYLLDDNRDYNLTLSSTVKNIFEEYGANYKVQNQILDSLKDTYDFIYELEESKIVTDDRTLTKILPYSEDGMNQTYLVDGRKPLENNEVTILPGYANAHGIQIGDTIMIGTLEYIVVGFTYAPDYIYPLISFSMPIFDEKTNNIVYMNEEAFSMFNGICDNVYSIIYTYEIPRKFEIEESDIEENDSSMAIFKDEHIVMDTNTITRMNRIGALQLEFASNRLFAEYFLYLLLTISVVIIVIITKKRIDDEKLQIGVLKSLGYNRFSIATSYLVYPILGSVIGGIFGYIIGILIHKPIATILLSSYCVPLDHFTISFDYLKTSIFVPMGVLSFFTYLMAICILRKKPLALLREGSNLKINVFSRICNRVTSFLSFESRFKYSLAFRSLGKLLLVTFTSFCTGLLIVFALIGMNLFHDVIDQSFAGVDYKYVVSLSGVTIEEIGDFSKTDYILDASIPLTKIIDSSGNEKELEEDVTFSFTGIDERAKFVRIFDDVGTEMNSLLTETDGIIVNENSRELLGLEIGDTLTFTYENIVLNYIIIGFSSEYIGYSAYIDRSLFSHDLGFITSIYTSMYSNDNIYQNLDQLPREDISKIVNVFSIEDLKDNILNQMDRFNGSIYLVVIFASFMTFIIIAVIANIVVEENKKTISLMKVMGYKDKVIYRIVLTIYTPFIIGAYFLSIPVMLCILKSIVKVLVGNIKVTIPIVITPFQIMIGLIFLLISYYIAIGLSKRILKKVPLSVALKRE